MDVRRGLLGKGAFLTTTSKPERTSPVTRGKWVMANILGMSPPDPPPNVPPLPPQESDSTGNAKLPSMRMTMLKHRVRADCVQCHSMMDPIGFSLEQFDGIGKYRKVDAGFQPIDASGQLPDGTKFANIDEFRGILLSRKEQFVNTLTNKLMMYALGRATDFYDAPALRKVVHDAAANNYKFSSIVLGIVKSTPFQMRKVGATASATQQASLQ
jgi:uncharacterized protein DUF1588/uncharacterized protein DUF1585